MRIGFVNGCFDLLHPGHIQLLQYAKSFVDVLVVAIDSDGRIKQMKGETRPIHNVTDRAIILKAIRYVDIVRVFNSNEELTNIIKEYYPDVMVVGSDYKGKEVIGSQYAKELKFFERIPGYSTTEILKQKNDTNNY